MIDTTQIEVNGEYEEYTAEVTVDEGIIFLEWVKDEKGKFVTDQKIINQLTGEFQDMYDNPDEDMFRSDDDR